MSINRWKFANSESNSSVCTVFLCAVCFVLATSCTKLSVAQVRSLTEEIVEPYLLTFRDPNLVMPPAENRLPQAYLTLWIEALSGPEQELKRDVALDISRAHRDGYLDCSMAADALLDVLKDHTLARTVRVEVARALINLDSRQCSATLKELLLNDSGTQFEMLVEPALARWHNSDMQTIWRQRLTRRDVPRYRRLLAVRALAELPTGMTSDSLLHDELINLITTSRDAAIVQESARTLGIVKRSGLESLAEKMLLSVKARDTFRRLAGVYLLLHHSSDSSRDLLIRVVTESLPDVNHAPVIRAAWSRLLELDAAELVALAPQAIHHSDPEVRRVAIDTIRNFANEDGIKLLGLALDDRHPEIRRAARQAMLELSDDDKLDEAIRLAGTEAVAGSSWRAQEQAIMLLAILEQTDTADRLLELLHSPRAEVAIAAAWALKRLNLPEKSVALLEFVQLLDQQISDGEKLHPHQVDVLAHVFEAFGRGRYEPAVSLLKRWIPKSAPRVEFDQARCAAVWALGWIYEDTRDLALAATLSARFFDYRSLDPESFTVRYACGISLGRIGARDVAVSLKPSALAAGNEVDLAAAWAIKQLTGEIMPVPTAVVEQGNHWKLLPIGSRRKVSTAKDSIR